MSTITPKEFKEKMSEIAKECGDTEEVHINADDLLCKVLIELGYGEGVGVYEDIGKWYA